MSRPSDTHVDCTLRMPRVLQRRLRARADDAGMSLNAWINLQLTRRLAYLDFIDAQKLEVINELNRSGIGGESRTRDHLARAFLQRKLDTDPFDSSVIDTLVEGLYPELAPAVLSTYNEKVYLVRTKTPPSNCFKRLLSEFVPATITLVWLLLDSGVPS